MMPFNLSFRRLLHKYFPQLTGEDLNRHESLLALRHQLIHELNYPSSPPPPPERPRENQGSPERGKVAKTPRERIKLTESSFECLKQYKSIVPVIAKLSDLKNKGFTNKEEFLKALTEIGDDQIDRHKSLILNHAKGDIERATRAAERIFLDKKITKEDYDKVHDLWINRRRFAYAQRYFFQFPFANFSSYLKRLWAYRKAQLKALPIYLKNQFTRIVILILLLRFLSILVIISIPSSKPVVTLYDLQREISVAKNEGERQKIVDRLDKYYLNLAIPDSVRQHVGAGMDSLIKHDKPEKLLQSEDNELHGNVYQLENVLNDVLRDALIARAQMNEATYQGLIRYAKTLANAVDEGTDYNYWQPWVARVADFDSTQVRAWLQADRAKELCSNYLQDQKYYELSEQYGSYGLKLLEQVNDERLRLDIMQRLLYTLYEIRGMYDLFSPIALKEASKADSLKYHLRVIGLTYHHANALFYAGYNKEALKEFEDVIKRARLHSEIPYWAGWYEAQALLGVARANRDLGNYQKARAICEGIAQLTLDNQQRIQLHNTQGIIYRNLSLYEQAKDEYNTLLNLAKSTGDKVNQIYALNNLGIMYYFLADFNRADDFIRRARELLEDSNLQNIRQKSLILLNLADIMAERNEKEEFDKTIEQANDLIKFISLPNKKAQFLSSLGSFNKKAGNFQRASDYFREALSIYAEHGLVRLALDTKSEFIECLISLTNFAEAKEMAENLYRTADANHDELAKIEGIGLLARIAYKEGKLENAILKSNQLIRIVENLSKRISDDDLLTIFRQKSYPYLHEAVSYELERGNIDSAFIKLDYIKGRALKKELSDLRAGYFLNIDTLKERLNEKQLLINYFVTNNTVYAFVLDRQSLKLYKKQVDLNDLTRLANDFILLIEKSTTVFKEPYSVLYDQHYEKISSLSSKLFQDLLGWQGLMNQLKETEITYIVPDNILYKIPFSCLKTSTGKDSSFLLRQTATINLPSAVFIKPHPTGGEEIYHKKVLMSINHNFPKADELENAIKKLFQNTSQLIVNEPEIHKEDVLSILNQGYDIYIFLGHSEANSINPELSTFELTAIRQSDFSDHTIEVSLADLKSVDWSRAETVFLIGCETAKGPLYSGTGLGGLQQGLLTLGAQEVLASDWKIDAIHAIPQTIEFLKSWGRSNYSAATLRTVQTRTIQDLQNHSYYKLPHPYIWASFILSQTALN